MFGRNDKDDLKIQIWRALDVKNICFAMMNQVTSWIVIENITYYLCVWIKKAERVKQLNR